MLVHVHTRVQICAGALRRVTVTQCSIRSEMNWCWHIKAYVNKRSLKILLFFFPFVKKKKKSLTTASLSEKDNGKKKPTENNQRYFQFNFVTLLLFWSPWWFWRRGAGDPVQWWKDFDDGLPRGLAGGQSDSVWYPATCDHLHLSGTSDAAGGYNQIRLLESLQEEVDWILNTQLWPADGYDRMVTVTTEGCDGLEPPPLPFKVLTPSLMDYFGLHLHRLYSLSSVPVSFYKCVFYCFLLDMIFLWSFLCISVLLWFGFCLLCVFWGHKFSVSKLSLGPLSVLSFDLAEFVFNQEFIVRRCPECSLCPEEVFTPVQLF